MRFTPYHENKWNMLGRDIPNPYPGPGFKWQTTLKPWYIEFMQDKFYKADPELDKLLLRHRYLL